MALYWPVDANITQQFASNPSSIQPNGHTGIDFGVALNTPVKAAGAGTIVFANWANTLSSSNKWWIAPAFAGICVVIDHGNGLLTLYAHLNKTDLNAGDYVNAGQVIGLSGSTGLSSGPHLHFEVLGWPLQPYNGFYGRLNPNNHVGTFIQPASSATKINQRKVGPDNVNHRSQSNSGSEILRVIPANSVEEFYGYVHGENVAGNDLWYQDAQGFAWSGGFTEQKSDGLVDIAPPKAPAIKANQRIVGPDNVNHRTQSNTGSDVLRVIPANSTEEFYGYVHGENVKGNDLWYQDALGFSWSGGFIEQKIDGLVDIAPKPAPLPTPPVVVAPTPVPIGYSFQKDFDFVEYQPAHASNVQVAKDNPGVVVFPPKPTHVVLHQFDAKEKQPTISGAIKHFQTERPGSESSAHFLASGDRIIQAVSLQDRAYHAGKIGNDYIGIEVDPDEDAATVASVKKLLKAIKAKYGYLPIYIRHRDVPGNATLCGADIHLELYSLAEPVTPPVTKPPVVVPPVVVVPPIPTIKSERQAVQAFVDWVVNEYFKTK